MTTLTELKRLLAEAEAAPRGTTLRLDALAALRTAAVNSLPALIAVVEAARTCSNAVDVTSRIGVWLPTGPFWDLTQALAALNPTADGSEKP